MQKGGARGDAQAAERPAKRKRNHPRAIRAPRLSGPQCCRRPRAQPCCSGLLPRPPANRPLHLALDERGVAAAARQVQVRQRHGQVRQPSRKVLHEGLLRQRRACPASGVEAAAGVCGMAGHRPPGSPHHASARLPRATTTRPPAHLEMICHVALSALAPLARRVRVRARRGAQAAPRRLGRRGGAGLRGGLAQAAHHLLLGRRGHCPGRDKHVVEGGADLAGAGGGW